MRISLWLGDLRDDLKYASAMWHAPAFTLVATVTLALGIGANSAIFALSTPRCCGRCRLATRPAGCDRENGAKTSRSYVSPPQHGRLDARSARSRRIAAFKPSVGGMVMAGADGNAETVSRQGVTAGIFDVLGIVRSLDGRSRRKTRSKRANVIVLSEGFWRTRYTRIRASSAARCGSTAYRGRCRRRPRRLPDLGRTSIWR